MIYKNRQIELGDMFSITFDLFKSTFLKSIVVVFTFLLPAAFILNAGFSSLLSKMSLNTEADILYEDAGVFFPGIFIYLGSLSLFMILYLAAWIGVAAIAKAQIETGNCSAGDGFRTVFSGTYLKVIGQLFLIGLVFMAILSIPGIIILMATASRTEILAFTGVLLLAAAFLLLVYLSIKWYFAPVHIIITGDSIFNGLSKSSFLVRSFWWRTFGIILLFSILVDIIISLVSTPVFIFVMWDFISTIISSPETFETESVPAVMISLFKKIGFLVAYTSLLQLLITPLYTVVMYYDLRIRKNDAEDELMMYEDPFSASDSLYGH